MKFLIGIGSFICGLAACYLLFSFDALPKFGGIPAIPNDVPQSVSIYLSFIGVMLTAVTVVLTALGIGIGVVAAITFAGLKTEARSIAKTTAEEVSDTTAREVADTTARQVSDATAKEVASEALSEVRLKGIVEAYLAVYVRERRQVAEWGDEPDENEER